MKGKHITVAEYLDQQIALSGVPQKDIAVALGYDKPNIITMFKQGKTKIPLNKVAPLAKVLGIDPVHFLRLVMTEYSPETWEVFEQLLGQRMVSENEQRVLEVMRSAAGGQDVAPKNEQEEAELAKLFGSWGDYAESVANAAVQNSRRRHTPA